MSKIICDVCGTRYPDSAEQCPICGCVHNFVPEQPNEAETVMEEEFVVPAGKAERGGHFSKANVRKRTRNQPVYEEVEMATVAAPVREKAVEDFNSYPLKQFLEEELLVSVHTDNRTVSGTTMEQEEKLVKERLQISDEMWLQCTKNAIHTAFASDEMKEELMRRI